MLILKDVTDHLICCVGKNFLRPGQMNINVATWGRLMKRALPPNCSDTNTLSPPSQLTSPGMATDYIFKQLDKMNASYKYIPMLKEVYLKLILFNFL